MLKCILLLLLTALLLCACSNQTPAIEPVIEPELNPSLSANPNTLIPNSPASPIWSESASQVQTAEPSQKIEPIAIEPEVIEYFGIIKAYQEANKSELEDIHEAFEDFYIKIAKELVFADELDFDNFHENRSIYELWCSLFEVRHSNLGYAINDINNDGIAELVILSDGYDIHAIYSLHDDLPVLVGAYWARHRCVIDKTGTLYISSSGGAADGTTASYLFVSGSEELQLIEMYGMESFDSETGERFPEGRCYKLQNGNKVIIDYEEAYAFWESFPDVYPDNPTKYSGLVFVPLFK